MTIYQRMSAAFEAASVPGFLQFWRKTDENPTIPSKFAVYMVPRTEAALCADDEELIRQYDVTIHLYGTTDISQERDTLEEVFETAGFEISSVRDLADVLTGEYQYHTRFDMTYYENQEEDNET